MKITLFWASMALSAPAALAQSTSTTSTTSTSTSAAPSCTASLITTLCDYEEPGPDFAVASSGTDHCLGYCNDHQPCDFVIFAAGNPYLGTGTCWLYPGETYDASKGTPSSECQRPYISVYDKPECTGESATTTTSGACEATASPSAVASVCGYPAPEDCFSTCIASDGASHCLSECAEADECSYAVFNPHNPSNSPYASGTCWVYTNGTFDEGAATECTGEPEQFVYENPCPKPSSSAEATGSSGSSSGSSSSAAATETASEGSTSGSTAVAAKEDTTTEEGSAARLSLTGSLAVGVAVLMGAALY